LDWSGIHVGITGASSGIGRALAIALSRQGASVGLISRRHFELLKLENSLRLEGGKVASCPADCRNPNEMDEAIKKLESALGPTDVMVASAGVGYPTAIDLTNLEQTTETFETNVLGVIHAFRAVLPGMIHRKSGQLAAVSSLAAFKGFPGESAYCASKAAVNTFLEGMRIRLKGTGVVVTTICPGFVKTPMTDINNFHMPFLVSADSAAQKIMKALENRKSVACFPWQVSALVGLLRLCPDRLIQWLFADYNSSPPCQSG